MNVNYSTVFQIDEFIEHAKFHMEEYGDSFTVFISKHYGDLKDTHNKKHKEEKPAHEKLPFQQDSHLSSVPVFVLNKLHLEKQKTECLDCSESIFYYQNNYSSLYNKGVFQPPKFV